MITKLISILKLIIFSACFPGWTFLEHTVMCYKDDRTKKTWSDALKSCESSSPTSTLASVHDKTTNDFLTTLSGGTSWTWIGGYQDDNEAWHWADGSRWTGYNNWGQGQPDNARGEEDHLGLNFPGRGLWNDFSGVSHPQGYICQYTQGKYKPSLQFL